MIERPVSAASRLAAFLRAELGYEPGRDRAFARTLIGLLLVFAMLQVFKPDNGYWGPTFVLLIASPAIGHSGLEAVRRTVAVLAGGAVATVLVICAFDLPWIYVPLQAAGIGVALFLALATPLGLTALAAGTTFAVISGGTRDVGAAGLIDLAWVRLGLAVLGCGLGAFAQLTCWPSDPYGELRQSLESELAQVEALVAGKRTRLTMDRAARHFELLGNAEVQHPALVHRRAHLSLLILRTAALVDESLTRDDLPEESRARLMSVLAAECAELRRHHDEDGFVAPPALPPPPPVPPRRARSRAPLPDDVILTRRACLKAALSAFFALSIIDAMQFPAAGALLACLVLGQQMSTGTDISKPLTLLGALAFAMGVLLVTTRLAAPNVDDVGSYLVVSALALAPTAWAVTAGPRVRIPGQLATVLMSVGLLGPYRATADLEPASRFLVSLAIGCLVVTAVDRAVWPVSRRHVVARRLTVMVRSASQLMGDLDPRLVLAPSRDPRWEIHRNLRALANLRAEVSPPPAADAIAAPSDALRLALKAQQWVVARIEQAQRELRGEARLADTAEQRRVWEETLRSEADRVERENPALALAPR
jgi:uncharacterized membrane protein YccC